MQSALWTHIYKALDGIFKLSEDRKGLYIVIIFSFVLKTIILIALFDKPVNSDGILYISAAKQFAAGNFKEAIEIYRMPLYPILIACLHFIVPDWVLAGRLISYFCLMLAVIPLYLLTRDLFDQKIAFWTGILFVLSPVPNSWTVYAMRGPAFVFCFGWAAYYAQKAICDKNIKYFVYAGLFSWISVFFRIEGIIFIPYFMIFLIGLSFVIPSERVYLFKGFLIWIAYPVFFSAALFLSQGLGLEISSFNRINSVRQELTKLLNFTFFNNYQQIKLKLEELSKLSPFSGYNQNFAEITRNYIPLIYFVGLIEKLINVIFLFNVIPLLMGLKHRFKRNHFLILSISIVFMILVYFRMIERDYLSSRFLFVSAFLLFPWVGNGFDRMIRFIAQSSSPRVYSAILIVLLILIPFGKTVLSFGKNDNVTEKAGIWLTTQPGYDGAKVVTNDLRILFYSKRDVFTEHGRNRSDTHLIYHSLRSDYSEIEKAAKDFHGKFVLLKKSVKDMDSFPEFEYYRKIKVFTGKKDMVEIYCSPDIYKTTEF